MNKVAFIRGFTETLTKAAKSDERDDPPGVVGMILKVMRRIGGDADPSTIRAFRRLAANVPRDKRPY